jgi:hypothetical protein
VLGINVVERFDYGTAELLFYPATFGHALFNSVNTTVALLRVIIARVNDDHVLRRFGEQIGWQRWYVLLRNRYNNNVPGPGRLLDCDRSRAGLRRQIGQRFRSSRIRDENLMPKRGEPSSQCAADVACSNDTNFHSLSSYSISYQVRSLDAQVRNLPSLCVRESFRYYKKR